MKRMLPLFVLVMSGVGLRAQEYRTVHCTDKCRFVVHDTLEIGREDENGVLSFEPWTNQKMGLLRFGEVVSLDTTDFRGVYELDIPDFQDTDIYNLTRFCLHFRWSCGGRGYEDTLHWEYDRTGWISELIRCKEHGRSDDATPMGEEAVAEQLHIDIFPVPAYGKLNIRFSAPFSGRASVLSLSGIEQVSSPIMGEEIHQLELENLSGTYILLVYDEAGMPVRREKIVVL